MTSVLIAGGLRGMGLGVARAFAGMPNVNIGLQHERSTPTSEVQSAVDSVRRLMRGQGRVVPLAADLTDSADVTNVVSGIVAEFGKIEVCVAAPSLPAICALEETTDAMWAAVIADHLSSAFLLTRSVLVPMRQQSFGRIIHVASTDGVVGRPHYAAVSAAKHGVIGLTRSVAVEVAHENVTANVVCPGLSEGPLLESLVAQRMRLTGETAADARETVIGELSPSMRLVTDAEIGEACMFLSLPSARATNGVVLTLDGGATVQ